MPDQDDNGDKDLDQGDEPEGMKGWGEGEDFAPEEDGDGDEGLDRGDPPEDDDETDDETNGSG